MLERLQRSGWGIPDPVAVSSGAEELKLSQLTERSATLAAHLAFRGLRVVGLHMDNRPDWIIIDLACQLAGICVVPLPAFFSPEQLAHVLCSVPIDAVFTDQPAIVSYLVAALSERGLFLRFEPGRGLPSQFQPGEIELLGLERKIQRSHAAAPRDEQSRNDVVPAGTGKITFTSGSTGRPKGVCLSNAQLLKQAATLAAAAALERPRHLCLLPLSTLLENVAGVYAPLLASGEVIVPSLAEIGFDGSSSLDPGRFVDLLGRIRPDSVIMTPQILRLLVTEAERDRFALSSLRFVAVGGARVPPDLLAAAHSLGIPAFEGYGLSECASVVSLNLPGASRPGSCGRPLPHVRVALEDDEIHVAGNAMLGYAGEPASWNQSSIATGDLGYLDADGYLYITGRKKNLLISSFGRNIAPEWVENEALVGGALAECLVFGDDRPYCVALVTPGNDTVDDDSIQRAIDRANSHLPDFARIQRWHRLEQPLSASPDLITDNGRPRRHAVFARYRNAIDALYESGPSTGRNYARTA